MTCPHGDHPACCLDCLESAPAERPNPPPPTVERDGPTFPARFPGHCTGCNLPVHEGQTICRVTDGTYCHEGCT